MKILLHSCCAPCSGYVFELLEPEYAITSLFYNPNIAPMKEYKKRLEELRNFCDLKKITLIEGEYDPGRWTGMVKEHRFSGERSERCRVCYEIRLRKSFECAAANNINIVATTLSISPHKDADMINDIGKKLAGEFGIEFIEADFKKNDGFKKSLELSRAHGFYRQNYCGCVYSKLERDKNSLWYKKLLEIRPEIRK